MYRLIPSAKFNKDVKSCIKKHWNMEAFREAIMSLEKSDQIPLPPKYKDHALTGNFKGYRALHIDSAPHPPKDQWVLLYKTSNKDLALVRTGSHDIYETSL